jgi:hypothetical protein
MLFTLILSAAATGADGIGSRPVVTRSPIGHAGNSRGALSSNDAPTRLPGSMVAAESRSSAVAPPGARVLENAGGAPTTQTIATGKVVAVNGSPASVPGTKVVEVVPTVDDRFAGLPHVPARRQRWSKWPRQGGSIVTRNYRYEGGRISSPTDLNGLGGGPGTDPGRRDTFIVVLPPLYDGWFVIPR